MSEFKDLLKRLEATQGMERREFLRHSLLTGISLGAANSFISAGRAQTLPGEDMEEIVVFGGTFLETTIKKNQAKLAADYVRDAAIGTAGFGAGLVGIGLGGAVESGGLTILLVIDGAMIIVVGAELFLIAFLLEMVALDPPRANYKVDHLLEGPLYAAKLLQESKNLSSNSLLLNTDEVAVSVRRIWDSLELWQGAMQAQDLAWMETHGVNFRASVDEFAKGFRQLPANLRAALQSFTDPSANPNYKAIVDETKRLAGQRMGDIPGVKEILKDGINWNAEILDGFQDRLRAEMTNLVVQPFDQKAFQDTLNNVRKAARYFESV